MATRLVERVLPGVSVSAKTVERAVGRCAAAVGADQETAATTAMRDERTLSRTGKPFVRPARAYVGLDGVLGRARRAKGWLEVQVGSLWSAWRDLTARPTPAPAAPSAAPVG